MVTKFSREAYLSHIKDEKERKQSVQPQQESEGLRMYANVEAPTGIPIAYAVFDLA